MNINRKILAMALEKPLPQRHQRQRAAGQEHEGHFGHSLEGVLSPPGHHRSPPKQLVIGEPMSQIRLRTAIPQCRVRNLHSREVIVHVAVEVKFGL